MHASPLIFSPCYQAPSGVIVAAAFCFDFWRTPSPRRKRIGYCFVTKIELEEENEALCVLLEDILDYTPVEVLPEELQERIEMYLGEEEDDVIEVQPED